MTREAAETCDRQDQLFEKLLDRTNTAEGKVAQAGNTIRMLTEENAKTNQRIGALEARWPWYVWVGIGVVGTVATSGTIILLVQ